MSQQRTLNAIILDDDMEIAKGFADELSQLGFDAKSYNQWAAAKLALISSTKVDLLVIDNALGEAQSGIQLAGQLCNDGYLAETKVIVVTGFRDSLEGADEKVAKMWKLNLCRKPAVLTEKVREIFQDTVFATPKQVEEHAVWWRRLLHFFSTKEGVGVLGVITVAAFFMSLWPSKNASLQDGNNPFKSPPIKVRVAVNPVPLGALAIIAEEGGHWKAAGLEVQMISFPTGKASLESVLGEGAEFATAAETPIMRAGLAGHTPAVLATIASSEEDCKVCYRPDHGITKPTDLKGKKVATAFGTSAEYFMDAFLRSNGIRRDEVTALGMKPAEMVSALNRGDISAFFIWEPYPLEAEKLSKGKTSIFLGSSSIYTETFQIVTRQDYAQANDEVCQRVLRALLAAEQHGATNEPDATAKVAKFTGLAPADVRAIWKNFQFRVGLNQELVSLLESQAVWARAGDPTLTTNVSFQSLIWPDPLRKVAGNRVTLKP